MSLTKYGKYITREIIKESKYPQITTPIASYNGCRGGGNALQNCEWSCITKAFTMDMEPEVDNDRDQFLLFASSNINDSNEFQAEAELPIGKNGKKQVITEPTCVYIPKGLKHGPVKFKSIKKPIAFLSWYLSSELSTSWNAPDESKYLAKIVMPPLPRDPNGPPDVTAIHPPDTPFRYMRFAFGGGVSYMLWSGMLGFPAKASWSYGSTFHKDYFCAEPVHAHRNSHQINMYLGGNPLNIEDFDARIEISMGKELETHVIDTCAVDHYVPGLPHIGDEKRYVGKPFIGIMWVLGPDMNDYMKAAPVDKVLLSDEDKGEIMISKGASDYVPPTKMEDWVWPYPDKK